MMGKEKVKGRSLSELREEIDTTDRQLFSLIGRRMAIVQEIGALKRAQGQAIADPVREALLKSNLKDFSAGVLEPWHVEELASVLIKISRDLQARSAERPNS